MQRDATLAIHAIFNLSRYRLPMHTVVWQRAANRIDITIDGFVNFDTLVAIGEEIRALAARTGSRRAHDIFCDLSGAMIAPGDVIAHLFSLLTNPDYKTLRAGRIAFFMTSMLSRLQMDRVRAARPGIAVFDDRTAALAWLAEPVSAAA